MWRIGLQTTLLASVCLGSGQDGTRITCGQLQVAWTEHQRNPAHDAHFGSKNSGPNPTISKFPLCSYSAADARSETFFRNHAEGIASIGLFVVWKDCGGAFPAPTQCSKP